LSPLFVRQHADRAWRPKNRRGGRKNRSLFISAKKKEGGYAQPAKKNVKGGKEKKKKS